MNQKILVIDDDQKLNDLLSHYLSQFGYQVRTEKNPLEGIRNLPSFLPDLVILDVMLPEMNGFDVCREIRKTSSIPIIMLTARGEVTDRIIGLELGADDYLPKPFEPRELVARIQSVLRRNSGLEKNNKDTLEFKDLTIHFLNQSVTAFGKKLELTTMEFEILSLFTRNPGEVLSRDKILDELRGIDFEAFNRSIDVLMSRLRNKLGDDPKSPRFFKTVWGSGYMFIGEAINHENTSSE